ncbi:hypothetical protein [Streptomyces bambusae]|uniref:Uncharacterized protein n=1 Tax=Streptomyces bambusae TaxID=1550616 RepID=A0ABS6Z967_9ACTN|nr:hypothetical protein [Streptomyces bambusae]MBW5484303.1 hypothetical protein [Streptomyces bambusae]
MELTHVGAVLLAEERLPGIGPGYFRSDAWQVRDGAVRMVGREGEDLLLARISADPVRIFDARERRAAPRIGPRPDARRTSFASPLPDGALAVLGSGYAAVVEADGRTRWTYEHEPWADEHTASGACTTDASGTRLLVTTPGPMPAGAPYAGDLLVVLALADGRLLGQTVLPSASAGYGFQQSLTDPAQIFLDAPQGDTCHALLVTLDGDVPRAEHVGYEDEPFAGLARDGAFLKLDVGGEWLGRYRPGDPDVSADAEDVLPEGLRFVGYRPGFLDTDRVLAAVAEHQDGQDNRHLLLDAHTLRPTAELAYEGTTCCDPLPLGDGTWLTTHPDDTLRRWRPAISSPAGGPSHFQPHRRSPALSSPAGV